MAQGGGREYRKGNWTSHETMILIEAKKMDNVRRTRKDSEERMGSSSRPSELRWKWVEDYCWSYGCNRSQNQCNDKWDNLMRDYKKVRNHETRVGGAGNMSSYWNLERNERKEMNLPSNFLPQVYEALFDVVERRGGEDRQTSSVHPLPLLMEQHRADPTQEQIPLSVPVPSPTFLPNAQVLPALDSGASEYSTPPARKRRRRRREEGSSSSNDTTDELGSAISESVAVVAEALKASEEKLEMRHKDLIGLKERNLKVEESNAEISAMAMDGLVSAINKLATSVLGLVSERKPRGAPK